MTRQRRWRMSLRRGQVAADGVSRRTGHLSTGDLTRPKHLGTCPAALPAQPPPETRTLASLARDAEKLLRGKK